MAIQSDGRQGFLPKLAALEDCPNDFPARIAGIIRA
jgi:hypothetical protein